LFPLTYTIQSTIQSSIIHSTIRTHDRRELLLHVLGLFFPGSHLGLLYRL
jgi:hypothetical protein